MKNKGTPADQDRLKINSGHEFKNVNKIYWINYFSIYTQNYQVIINNLVKLS